MAGRNAVLVKFSQSRARVRSALEVWMDARWELVKQIVQVVSYARFSVLVVVACALLLLLHPQGREIAARAGGGWDSLRYPFATALFAFQAWFWSRIILKRRFVSAAAATPHPQNVGARTLLRAGASGQGFMYALATGVPRWTGIVACAIPVGAVGWMLWLGQIPMARGLGLLLALVVVAALLIVLVFNRYHELEDRAFDTWVIAGSVAQLIALTLWGWFAPNGMGHVMGSGPTLLLAFASLIPGGSGLVLLALRNTFPIVSALTVAAIVLSSCHPHFIRASLDSKVSRPTLEGELDRWSTQAPTDQNGVPTLVIVASAGGGITAAYWTATVLGELRAADPEFGRRLYALSAVSGGSVGAAVFAQSLACERDDYSASRVRTALHGDLLAPVIASGFYADLLNWFPPFSAAASRGLHVPDRAVAFEREMERNWTATYGTICDGSSLEDSFTRIRRHGEAGQPWQPILMLNATHQETGRLVVLSQAQLESEAKNSPFDAVIDYFALPTKDLRLSTAAHNSARFPYVSPVGRIPLVDTAEPLNAGHLADGGYFNVDGATTAIKVIERLRERLFHGMKVIVIQISVDTPSLKEAVHVPQDLEYIADEVAHAPHLANEVMAPLTTLVATRGGHGATARSNLRVWSQKAGADYFHFRLLIPQPTPQHPRSVKPPLGWVLSLQSQEQIATRTLCLDANAREWNELMSKLGKPSRMKSCGKAVVNPTPDASPLAFEKEPAK